MLTRAFHRWERWLAARTPDRVVRPFDWGLDWIPTNGHQPGAPPDRIVSDWVAEIMADTDAFFRTPSRCEYTFLPDATGDPAFKGGTLMFPSGFITPHPANNTSYARFFPSRAAIRSRARRHAARRAVVVLPQWNADASGHVGLCRVLARLGMSALRLSLPYHDRRMPPELHRADYIVSANVARTIQVCRQAVIDARLAVRWLKQQGYERIGILGTSLGSCLAMLTAAHEPAIHAQALNHISPFFADVAWQGLSTAHVRTGLEGCIDLERLRALWRPISPRSYLDRIRDTQTLLVYARYDLTFPVELSRALVEDFRRYQIPHQVAVLPCGHYSTGVAPFKYLDGFLLARFLDRQL